MNNIANIRVENLPHTEKIEQLAFVTLVSMAPTKSRKTLVNLNFPQESQALTGKTNARHQQIPSAKHQLTKHFSKTGIFKGNRIAKYCK
ncbi:MAG: hypothetical protein L3J21_07040 [Devosiaceae bacterium]|nr:hypothetical protein [Devosiaceae bacterium]